MHSDLETLYFEWIGCLVFPNRSIRREYQLLLKELYTTVFFYTLPLDENRMIDGLNLRYRFYNECGYNFDIGELNNISRECTVLEMMTALALRCDEEIMFDPEIGSRVHIWFFEMLKNLGLSCCTDPVFNYGRYNLIISKLLNRDYEPNGIGGLFIVNKRGDIRNSEIWYQLCWHLDEYFRN